VACSAAATISPRPLQVVIFAGLPVLKIWLIFCHGLSSMVTLTVDLLTLKLARNVTRGTNNLPANFGRVMGKHVRVKLTTWRCSIDL